MDTIPDEVMGDILSLLDITSLVLFSTTCKKFKSLTSHVTISMEYTCDIFPMSRRANLREKVPLINQCMYDGHLHILKYLKSLEYKWNTNTCSYAAENGHLECLKYAHENGCEWD